jgi:hypothetical protein
MKILKAVTYAEHHLLFPLSNVYLNSLALLFVAHDQSISISVVMLQLLRILIKLITVLFI